MICNSETKFNKILPYLRNKLIEGKEYCLFCDARDVVFVDTTDAILEKYNSMNIDGVLFNANSFCGTWPCEVESYTDSIVRQYGGRGVVNSGVYIGRISDVISLIEDAIIVINGVRNEDYSNALFSFLPDELINDFNKNKNKYSNSDQFAIQTLQFLSHPLIKSDNEKELFAVFGEKYPFVKDRKPKNNYAVDWYCLGDDSYIGDAKVLHSPWLSKNKIAWRTWIREEVLRQ